MRNDLLDYCDLSVSPDGKTLIVKPRNSPSILSPRLVDLESARESILNELKKRGLARADVFREEGKKPYPILALAPASLFSIAGIESIGRSNPLLARSLEPLLFADEEGNHITIVSMDTNRCKHSNVAKSRGGRAPQYWTGYDYLKSWRLDGEKPSNEYFELIGRLMDGETVPDYEYDLIRPDDGARVRYQTSYSSLVFFGERVRVGISKPEAFAIVEPGRPDRIIEKAPAIS